MILGVHSPRGASAAPASRTLAGFRSRWTTPCRWAASTPRARSAISRAARRGGNGSDPRRALGQAAARDEFQREERPAVGLADFVDLDDVGVVEAGDDLRFGEETGVFRRSVAAIVQDHLEGDDAVELELAGLVDDAHAAAAQLAKDLIAGHLRRVAAGAGEGAQTHRRLVARQGVRRGPIVFAQSGRGDRTAHGTNEKGGRADAGVGERPAVATGAREMRVHRFPSALGDRAGGGPWAGGSSCDVIMA